LGDRRTRSGQVRALLLSPKRPTVSCHRPGSKEVPMQIGEQRRTIIIEPIEVPGEPEPAPALPPEPEPVPEAQPAP
jgi:hypothetical protein